MRAFEAGFPPLEPGRLQVERFLPLAGAPSWDPSLRWISGHPYTVGEVFSVPMVPCLGVAAGARQYMSRTGRLSSPFNSNISGSNGVRDSFFQTTGSLTWADESVLDFGGGAFSVLAVAMTSSSSSLRVLCSKYDSGASQGWWFARDGTQAVYFHSQATGAASQLDLVTAAGALTLNRWHVIHGQTNGSGTSTGRIWVDGIRKDTTTTGAGATTVDNATDLTVFATGGVPAGASWLGGIGLLRIWRRIFRDYEALELAQNPLLGYAYDPIGVDEWLKGPPAPPAGGGARIVGGWGKILGG